MKEAHHNKIESIRYFEENGTLQGFKGKLYNSAKDFNPEKGPKAETAQEKKPEQSLEQKRKRLEQLRKKLRGE